MIEIKRNCSSSIHDNPLKEKITYGDFTIVISEKDYKSYDWLKFNLGISPTEMLQLVILAGIDSMKEEYEYPGDEDL